MMKATGSDQHLRTFAKVLEKAIAKYGDLSDEDLTTRQKRQVETLVAQEIDFRETLAKHPAGRKIYDQFCYYICEERRNILSARPFFRERQGVFMEFISPALKMGDGQALFPFGINYNFVRWVLKQKDWPAGSKLHKIARQIQQSRKELVEMNMPLALSRARIFWNKTRSSVMTTSEVLPGGSHLDYMDLVQIAAGGLIAGIDKFVLPYSHTFRAVVIGRIVGDTIEQFSETLLHFFPGDKRKIYRGRKFIGKTKEPDPYRMAVEVNKDMEGKYTTNPSEMNDLMKAATCESADAEIAHGDDGESLRVVDSLGDDPALQPDNKAEKQEIYDKLEFSLSTFPPLEQKLIKLKGVEFH